MSLIMKVVMLFNGPFNRYLNQDLLNEKYNELRRIWESFRYDIEHSSICIMPFSKKKAVIDSQLRNWLCWVNKNIILNLGLDSEITTRVKLRIAASMLNKVDSLTDIENVQIFTNLKNNVNKELCVLIYEELPF